MNERFDLIPSDSEREPPEAHARFDLVTFLALKSAREAEDSVLEDPLGHWDDAYPSRAGGQP